MRTRKSMQRTFVRPIGTVLLAWAMLAAALPAHAEGRASRAWGLFKERPVAVIVAVPAFLITSPFMLVTHLASDDSGSDE